MNIFKNWSKSNEDDKSNEPQNDEVMKTLEGISNLFNERRKAKGDLEKSVEIDENDKKQNDFDKHISNIFNKSNNRNNLSNSENYIDKEIKEKTEETKSDNITLMFKEAKLLNEHSQNLKGLYESFYQIKEGKYKESMVLLILEEYKGRIINIPELKEIGKFFMYVDYIKENEINMNEIFTFVEWWLSYLKLCGITRDNKTGELEVFNGIGRFYNEEDDEELFIGDKAQIVKPYWKQDDIVLEKGIIKKLV